MTETAVSTLFQRDFRILFTSGHEKALRGCEQQFRRRSETEAKKQKLGCETGFSQPTQSLRKCRNMAETYLKTTLPQNTQFNELSNLKVKVLVFTNYLFCIFELINFILFKLIVYALLKKCSQFIFKFYYQILKNLIGIFYVQKMLVSNDYSSLCIKKFILKNIL